MPDALWHIISAAMGALPFAFVALFALVRAAEGLDRPRALVEGYLAWVLLSDGATEFWSLAERIALRPFAVLWIAANAWAVYPAVGSARKIAWIRPARAHAIVLGRGDVRGCDAVHRAHHRAQQLGFADLPLAEN